MTTDQVLNTIPFGIGVACSARVGNLLGSREAKGAALSAQVAAWLSIAMGLLVGGILMGVKNNFGRLFNDDIEVVNLVARVMPWVAAFQVADGLNGSMGGALRGMGRQHVGAVVNIVSYYGGALPGGIWLAFHGWGLEGLWVGQCVALFLVGGLEWVSDYPLVRWMDMSVIADETVWCRSSLDCVTGRSRLRGPLRGWMVQEGWMGQTAMGRRCEMSGRGGAGMSRYCCPKYLDSESWKWMSALNIGSEEACYAWRSNECRRVLRDGKWEELRYP